MTLRTFDDWKACGYHVIKGQKALQRNKEGKCVFSRQQVERTHFSNGYNYPTKYSERAKDTYTEPQEPETVYYADGSGYRPASGPCGPLYFDKFGNT